MLKKKKKNRNQYNHLNAELWVRVICAVSWSCIAKATTFFKMSKGSGRSLALLEFKLSMLGSKGY